MKVKGKKKKEKKEKHYSWYGMTGWSACACVFCCCLGIQKMGFRPFRASFVLMYRHSKAFLFPVNTLFLAPSYIID